MISKDPDQIRAFHAHIYYDLKQKAKATSLRDEFLNAHFLDKNINVGRMHDGPIGPHTKPMFTVVFYGEVLRHILNHLMLNRDGLDVLIHPLTGNELKDHTECATWIGKPVALDTSKL